MPMRKRFTKKESLMENESPNWKTYATRLLLALESLAEHNKLLMSCIRDIDEKMHRDMKTKLRKIPLDK